MQTLVDCFEDPVTLLWTTFGNTPLKSLLKSISTAKLPRFFVNFRRDKTAIFEIFAATRPRFYAFLLVAVPRFLASFTATNKGPCFTHRLHGV